jgi:hypothetical protein
VQTDGCEIAAEDAIEEPGGRSGRLHNSRQSAVDDACDWWNTAPASVLCTVWGAASMLDLAVEIGVAPDFELRRTSTAITGKASVGFVAGATSVIALKQTSSASDHRS